MKHWLSPSLGMLALGSAAMGLPLAGRQIGHATQAQIEAVLPPSLKFQAKPDPAGEARYTRLLALAKKSSQKVKGLDMGRVLGRESDPKYRVTFEKSIRPLWAEIEKVRTGPIRIPKGKRSGALSFPEQANFQLLSKLIELSTTEAAARHDQVAAARYGTLGLRLANGMLDGHGTLIDSITALGMEGIAYRAVYHAEMANGFDASGRLRLLALMPPIRGPIPQLRDSIVEEFYVKELPLLVDPIKEWDLATFPDGKGGTMMCPGTYDPIPTARLVGRIFDAALADAGRRFDQQTNLARKLADGAGKGIPDMTGDKVVFRAAMVRIPNSIGRLIASFLAPTPVSSAGARMAAQNNLARAVLLLRSGKTAVLPDPFGKGNLRIDAKRRIVWSVGENSKDDGGKIERDDAGKSLDLGHRY